MSETSDTGSTANEIVVPPTTEPPEFQYSLYELDAMRRSVEHLVDRTVKRRSVLAFGGAMMLMAAVHPIESKWMDDHYQAGLTQLIIPESCIIAPPSQVASLLSPGWGGTHGESIFKNLVDREVYTNKHPSAYYHFGKDVTLDNIAACGRGFNNRFRPHRVDVHGISEGMMIAMTGALAAGRPVRLASSNDSPFDIEDARHSLLAQGIALANELGIYHGGFFGKVAVAMVEEMDKYGVHKLFTGWREALETAGTGADPRMMDSQLVVMDNANLHSKRREFRDKGIINRDTKAVVLKTKHTGSDKVVKDDQSVAKWLDWYEYCHAEAMELEVPKPGHAQLVAGYKVAAPHMRRVLAGERLLK